MNYLTSSLNAGSLWECVFIFIRMDLSLLHCTIVTFKDQLDQYSLKYGLSLVGNIARVTWGNQSKCMFCGIESTEKGHQADEILSLLCIQHCHLLVMQHYCHSGSSNQYDLKTSAELWNHHKYGFTNVLEEITFIQQDQIHRESSIMKKRNCIIVSLHSPSTHDSSLLPCEYSCLTCHRWLGCPSWY